MHISRITAENKRVHEILVVAGGGAGGGGQGVSFWTASLPGKL